MFALRPRNGIQTFGRGPVKRRRARSTRSRRAITTLMATAIMATSAPAVSSAQSSSYEIRPGDTLTQIARDHGISVEDLVRINGIADPDRIDAGTEIRLSEHNDDDDEIREGDTVYEIQPGDTLMAIAMAYDVTLADLIAINDIEDTNRIFAGDFLIIPTSLLDNDQPADDRGTEAPDETEDPTSSASAGDDDSHIVGLHLVASGESLSGIALRYGVTIDQLKQANDIENGDLIYAGDMLRIPDAAWDPGESASSASTSAAETGEAPASETEGAMLDGMPVQKQSLSLSAESTAASMATAYWGHQVSEWVLIENLPYHPNPHRGFRGEMSGSFGGTTDYGVYAKPISKILANYGFVGDEFYTMGDPAQLKDRIDRGQPVLVWMTNLASPQERFYDWYHGERFTLVPQQHVVVAYGYDDERIYVADPGNGSYSTYSWDAFIDSWSLFDGMSMAVYPKG